MSETAYPLQWPPGRPRTASYSRERAKFDVTFARARDNIVREVELLVGGGSRHWTSGSINLVISTNIALRRDGLPLAGQRAPDDPGVAVYFQHKKRRCPSPATGGKHRGQHAGHRQDHRGAARHRTLGHRRHDGGRVHRLHRAPAAGQHGAAHLLGRRRDRRHLRPADAARCAAALPRNASAWSSRRSRTAGRWSPAPSSSACCRPLRPSWRKMQSGQPNRAALLKVIQGGKRGAQAQGR
jgi:hypothetical protein